jgi:hypothetical protein
VPLLCLPADAAGFVDGRWKAPNAVELAWVAFGQQTGVCHHSIDCKNMGTVLHLIASTLKEATPPPCCKVLAAGCIPGNLLNNRYIAEKLPCCACCYLVVAVFSMHEWPYFPAGGQGLGHAFGLSGLLHLGCWPTTAHSCGPCAWTVACRNPRLRRILCDIRSPNSSTRFGGPLSQREGEPGAVSPPLPTLHQRSSLHGLRDCDGEQSTCFEASPTQPASQAPSEARMIVTSNIHAYPAHEHSGRTKLPSNTDLPLAAVRQTVLVTSGRHALPEKNHGSVAQEGHTVLTSRYAAGLLGN